MYSYSLNTKLIVFATVLRCVSLLEFSNVLFQNPGEGVNFYGDVQSNPTTSAKNIYDDLIGVHCANSKYNESSCASDKFYHYPGLLCQIDNPIPCNYSNPYRTYDGSCNNPHSSRLGMKNQCYHRFLPAYYEGFDGFRNSIKGGPLPEPRELSLKIFKEHHVPSVNVSSQFVFFGQYLFVDILHTVRPNTDCCSNENSKKPECKTISVSSDDPFYSKFNKTCLNFNRATECSCKTQKKAQANGYSFYLDSSQLYGLSEDETMKIRALNGTGKLKHPFPVSDYTSAKNAADSSCPKAQKIRCFDANGVVTKADFITDNYVTLFMREHNRIATLLKQINPHWEEEQLFQETRKIINAEYQCILFRDFLPILLTPRIMKEFGFIVPANASGMQYNSSVIPGIFNEFSTSSFRIHTMIPKHIDSRVNQALSDPPSLCQMDLTQFMRGMRQTPAEEYDRYMIEDLTNYLFQKPEVPYGMDLVSITIQRGRDNGLAPYTKVVEFCSEGTVVISSFDDLNALGLMSEENTDLLKQIYESVEDVDMAVGMMLENPIPGGSTGPSAVCINAKQFYFLQKADRFYFDLIGPEAQFTDDQRKTLKQTSWSRILCDNTNISQITKNPFLLPSHENSDVSCDEIPQIDLTLWKDN